MFYELTWSEVIESERQAIAFDNAKEHAFRRTELNGYMKQFFNDHVPDAFIYMSDARAKIFASVQQGVCWMTSGDWEDLPDRASERFAPARTLLWPGSCRCRWQKVRAAYRWLRARPESRARRPRPL